MHVGLQKLVIKSATVGHQFTPLGEQVLICLAATHSPSIYYLLFPARLSK